MRHFFFGGKVLWGGDLEIGACGKDCMQNKQRGEMDDGSS